MTRCREHRRQSGSAAGQKLPEEFLPCPIRTNVRCLHRETEIRAYKLGKRRWSYNQCALELLNPLTGVKEEVVDCMQYGATTLTDKEEESAVSYQVRLKNGFRIRVHVFAVYDSPREVVGDDGKIEYEWPCITRAACPKQHCEGPVLRTIQRFGKLGRRSGQNAVEANGRNSEHNMKDAKYMFVSIDEAGSHVKVKHFRLVVGMYATGDTECLASTISGPIRVLANNDVPTGAAFIKLQLQPEQEWDGWSPREFQPRLPESMIKYEPLPTATGHENSHSVSSNETDYVFIEGRRKQSRDLQRQASLRDVIVRHAHDWSNDADLGAGRLGSAISNLGYSIDSASSPQSRSFSEGGPSPNPNFPFSMPDAFRFAPGTDTDGSPVLGSFGTRSLDSSMLLPSAFGMHSPSTNCSPDLPSNMSTSRLNLTLAGTPTLSSPTLDAYSQLASIQFPPLPMLCNPFSQFKAPSERDPGGWLVDAMMAEGEQ